ncbi:FtsX-like permease family protein [Streptacidiphilus anmyonensis]|uniref:FtsX-like permease family protein n=1 Tax=Streptacidiphilus anmyonensis TaxID=405782 RepID=UPI0005A9D2FA|nr:FtsX-like permease family protein [Streptacidiphilus anmyonensis]
MTAAGGTPDTGERLRSWARDLALGARFALSGREAVVRTVLSALGVGLGVAMLLLGTTVPGLVADRSQRGAARDLTYFGAPLQPGPDTMLVGDGDTSWHGEDVYGRLVKPEGPAVKVVAGLPAYPAPGTMYASPALQRVLTSPQGALLRERLPYRIVGTISDAGLLGPSELAYYAGDGSLRLANSTMTSDALYRTNSIGGHYVDSGMNPILVLLSVVAFVVLLLPIAVFVATAARFGGERRDRRLAALRLIGADISGTHRTAAGEALVGGALGVLAGFLFFQVGRVVIGGIEIAGLSVFAHDVTPGLGMAALIALAVPLCSVLVTALALRGVAIEPLGVVRRSMPVRRRLWWRLLPPLLGIGLLVPALNGGVGDGNSTLLPAGMLLLLVGVASLLPWLIERVVARMGAGPVPLQLGSRRLQMSGGTAARAVAGITVAVAGAIGIQTLFAGVTGLYTKDTGLDPQHVQAQLGHGITGSSELDELTSRLRATAGVLGVNAQVTAGAVEPGKAGTSPSDWNRIQLTVGDCAALQSAARISDCRPGSVYTVGVPAGTVLDLADPDGDGPRPKPRLWKVPAGAAQTVLTGSGSGTVVNDPEVLATPQALSVDRLNLPYAQLQLRLAPNEQDAVERARNAAVSVDPTLDVTTVSSSVTLHSFDALRRGVIVGAAATMVLIGLSLALGTIEQLRERRRLLAVLVAFGTRRSTLALSVLWQTAVPMFLGLGLALGFGVGLGAILLRITRSPGGFDWTSVAELVGAGTAVALLATLISMPALWRLMRAEGLRTE